ncbi:unnamed protein product [Durusdinium trenchii]|uniref:Sfi1 spindle body domain-containing protein n=1 Tax=Durusdinium trenchii TaxID=1381693 RepID=A0ABP0HQM4_9DINO
MAWLPDSDLEKAACLARKASELTDVGRLLRRRRVLRAWSCTLRVFFTTDRHWRERLRWLLRIWHSASKGRLKRMSKSSDVKCQIEGISFAAWRVSLTINQLERRSAWLLVRSALLSWIRLAEGARQRDEIATTWCRTVVADRCCRAVATWHQAASLRRRCKALRQRKRLQKLLKSLHQWLGFSCDQQRLLRLVDACNEKRSRLAQRRAIFGLYQETQMKSYTRQLLSLASQKAKQLLLVLILQILRTWSAFSKKRLALRAKVLCFQQQQLQSRVRSALLQLWQLQQQSRQRCGLEQLAERSYQRVAVDQARLWLLRVRRQVAMSHCLEAEVAAKCDALEEETVQRFFQAWHGRLIQRRLWRRQCEHASAKLAALRCDSALRHWWSSAMLTRCSEQVRQVNVQAQVQRVLRSWFGLTAALSKRQTTKVQTLKAFITRLRVQCRQSQLSKAAAWHDSCRVLGLAFLSWQIAAFQNNLRDELPSP